MHRTRDGRLLTVETRIELTSGSRRLVLESTRDISERRKWEERQTLLLNELSHRVRNTLAVVQSMARQTLRSTPGAAEFVPRFEGRLNALATSHKLLVGTDWAGADLAGLAHGQVDAHAGGDLNRLSIRGAPVILPPDLATPFGLVLHELSTNAAKYGAFSTPEGRVELSWELEPVEGSGARRLKAVWRESGGPEVSEPAATGLGTQLIDHAIPTAAVERRYETEGFVCVIDLVLEEGDTP